MSAIAIYYEHKSQLAELQEVFAEIKGWEFSYLQADECTLGQLEDVIVGKVIDFLIWTTPFSKTIAKNLYYLSTQNPLLTIIYFNSILKNSEFSEFFRAGVKYCFIGERRQSNLHEALQNLISGHWKKIPQDLIPQNSKDLPDRVHNILNFIEATPIKNCNSENIARHLNISQSHFRKEFRYYFGINFREYKQRLLQHYEDVLLFDKNLKPGHIYKVLDYKNLSAFSRSFKSRHGVSWQNLVKTKD